MSNLRVCVECGEVVESLYVEFSEGNIRLTRCSMCSNVADKYIEYELILVLIDIILHRRPAFRHLLFNRQDFARAMNSIKWTFIGTVLVNSMLKFIILHEHIYSTMPAWLVFGHLILSSVLEHGISSSIIIWVVCCYRDYQTLDGGQNKFLRKLYFSIAFPEYLKCLTIFLQFFDSEPRMLFLFALLLVSIQIMSLQSLLNQKSSRIFLGIIFGNACRLAVKLAFYGLKDTKLLGFII